MSRVVKLIETGNRRVVPRAGGVGELFFNEFRVSLGEDGNILEIGGGDATQQSECT